jgi:hypothetical protein
MSNESAVNESVADKDWSRMLNLVLTGNNGKGIANTIKDKKKAIGRFVAGLKLSNSEFRYEESWRSFRGMFTEFGNRALELGATVEEIKNEYDNAIVPQKYLDQLKTLSSKKLGNRFVGAISKAIIDAGFNITYLNKGGNALTQTGRDAMARNGIKWTIGYKTQIDVNGQLYDFNFDAITDEGDGPTSYVVADGSDAIFMRMKSWKAVGVREFITQIIDALNRATTTI